MAVERCVGSISAKLGAVAARRALAPAVVVALLPSPALAVSWSVPAVVPGTPNTAAPYGNQTPTGVVITPGGNAVAGTAQTLSPVLADGTLGPAVTRPPSQVVFTALAGYGRERLLAVGSTLVKGNFDQRSRSLVAFGTTDGRLDAPRRLDPSERRFSAPVALAANASGGAAVIVQQRAATGSGGALVLLVRRPSGGFRRIGALVRGTRVGPAAVAINTTGDVLATWRHDDGLYARIVRADGGSPRVQRIGASGYAGYISAALDATRRAIVAWVSQNVSEGDLRTPVVISLAHAAPGRAFAAPQVLESVARTATRSYVPASGIEVALLRDRGIVAWTGVANRRFVVRTADIIGGRVSGRATLAQGTGDAIFSDLATGPRGGAIITWGEDAGFAAVRAATGGAFSEPERIADPSLQGFPALPRAAVDPVSGRVIAVWGGLIVPLPPGSAPVRNETRYAIRAPLDP